MAHHNTIIDRFFRDKAGRVVIGQKPNFPLIAWAILTVIAHFADPGTGQTIAQTLARLSLLVWAALEIGQGVNGFRKLLGIIVLCFSLVSWLL